jgi:hypothetical protein
MSLTIIPILQSIHQPILTLLITLQVLSVHQQRVRCGSFRRSARATARARPDCEQQQQQWIRVRQRESPDAGRGSAGAVSGASASRVGL